MKNKQAEGSASEHRPAFAQPWAVTLRFTFQESHTATGILSSFHTYMSWLEPGRSHSAQLVSGHQPYCNSVAFNQIIRGFSFGLVFVCLRVYVWNFTNGNTFQDHLHLKKHVPGLFWFFEKTSCRWGGGGGLRMESFK